MRYFQGKVGSHSTDCRAVAPLLFASGLCALVYQTTWMRQFRLIAESLAGGFGFLPLAELAEFIANEPRSLSSSDHR